MNKLILGCLTAALLLTTQPLLAAARVAVLHLAPFASEIDDTAVDIYINGNLTFEGVKYKDFVDYVELDAGDYTIDIVPVGATDPAISGMFTLSDGVDYSVFAVGNGVTQNLDLLALVDDNSGPMGGNVAIRVVHTAPFAAELVDTEVSIRTAGGDVVNGLVGVPYGANSDFFEVPAATYDLKVASNDGKVNYIDPLPAPLPAGAHVTLYAIGDGINQPLGILAFPVGELEVRPPVDNSANGWWKVLDSADESFVLQPVASQNRLVGTWNFYDETGAPSLLSFDSCFEDKNEQGEFECSTPGGFDGMTAETVLLYSTRDDSGEEPVVTHTPVGTLEFDIMGCRDAMVTVKMDGEEPMLLDTTRLVQPLPCTLP